MKYEIWNHYKFTVFFYKSSVKPSLEMLYICYRASVYMHWCTRQTVHHNGFFFFFVVALHHGRRSYLPLGLPCTWEGNSSAEQGGGRRWSHMSEMPSVSATCVVQPSRRVGWQTGQPPIPPCSSQTILLSLPYLTDSCMQPPHLTLVVIIINL